MIRLATVLLIASAYFSPAHAIGVDLENGLEPSVLESAGPERASFDLDLPAADGQPAGVLPLFADSVLARTETRRLARAKVPLPSGIWLFITALAAGLMVIRRRADRI
jgi:hypothetical protein